MSTLNSTYMPLTAGALRPGGGPESETIAKLFQRAWEPLGRQTHIERAINDLYTLQAEAEEGQHEAMMTSETLTIGKQFLLAFPKTLPAPELSLDSDGEISFDWLGMNRRMFSVSLGAKGRLSFAGRLGARRTLYGIEEFNDAVPEQIVESVRKIFST